MHEVPHKTIKVANAPRGIDRMPVSQICAAGSLPDAAEEGIDVIWRDVTFCSVSQMTALAAVQLSAHRAGVVQRYALPESDACSYMLRMDYCRVLGIEVDEGFVRHDPVGRFVPLSVIPIDEVQADPGGIADRLEEVVTRNTSLHRSASNMLNLSVLEVIDNVVQHSSAKSPGLACAQYYGGQRFVEMCVADCGVGIPASMEENPLYSDLTPWERMEAAFRPGTGQWYGMSGLGGHMVSGGVGLSYVCRLATRLGGHVWSVSGSEAIHIGSGGTERVEGLFYPGTVVVIRIPDTPTEVLESDILDDGRPIPVYWNGIDGMHTDGEDVLW